eukprot:Gb_12274 [translate_table: standard]
MGVDTMEFKDLIPGLPAELARECLLRVSYQYHASLKLVCRSWKTLVKSPSFYQQRKKAGTAEQCICLVQAIVPEGLAKSLSTPVYRLTVYSTLENSWKRLVHIPHFPTGIPLFSQCVSVNEKLILIGGWNPLSLEATNCVSIYDFSCNKWYRGADMFTARSFFACAAYGGKIYVSGGHDDNKNALQSAEVYNVDADEWQIIPDMTQERDESQGVFVDGKFYVISGYTTETQGQFDNSAEVYDPGADKWAKLDNMWAFAVCPRSCISVSGKLYFCHRKQVMEYNAKENDWGVVGHVPESLDVSPCATVLNDQTIFVCASASGGGDQVALLPDPENGNLNKGKACGSWSTVKKPAHFSGFVYSACTVEI